MPEQKKVTGSEPVTCSSASVYKAADKLIDELPIWARTAKNINTVRNAARAVIQERCEDSTDQRDDNQDFIDEMGEVINF